MDEIMPWLDCLSADLLTILSWVQGERKEQVWEKPKRK